MVTAGSAKYVQNTGTWAVELFLMLKNKNFIYVYDQHGFCKSGQKENELKQVVKIFMVPVHNTFIIFVPQRSGRVLKKGYLIERIDNRKILVSSSSKD
jgi:hypothetical protein